MSTHLLRLVLALLFAVPQIATAGEHSTERAGASAREPLLANGHWECHCTCETVHSGSSEYAELPGKCESDTEGSSCRVSTGYGGTLQSCSNVFVIDL